MRRGRLIFKGGRVQPMPTPTPTPPSPPSGPMTRARVKVLHDKVNSLLSTFDFGSTLDGLLLHADTLCVTRYEPQVLLDGRMEAGQEEGRKEGREEDAPGAAGTEVGIVPGSIPGSSRPPWYETRYGTGLHTGLPDCA